MPSGETGSTNRSAPSVTVIIPAYGVNDYIGQSIDSVLAQTYRDCEIVVVNDGAPPDETAELKAILAGYGGRIGYLERENGGQGAARNSAMRASRSEFVAFLDGDDIWMPTFLERQMELFAADAELALAYADARIFGETVAAGTTYMQRDPSDGAVTLESLLAGRCNVTMSAIVARRQRLIDAGWFDEELRYCEDFDLWFRMAHRGMRIGYRREPLIYRRVRSDALSKNDVRMNATAIFVLQRFAERHTLTPSERRAWGITVRSLRLQMAIAEAKLKLAADEYEAAVALLDEVAPDFANWKIRFARVGLRIAPSAVRASYSFLQRIYGWRQRRHVRRVGAVLTPPEQGAARVSPLPAAALDAAAARHQGAAPDEGIVARA
jgi:glycosyltransferase involved in cell wall biosynthesis